MFLNFRRMRIEPADKLLIESSILRLWSITVLPHPWAKDRRNKSKVNRVRGSIATPSAIESLLRCVARKKSLTSIEDSKSTLPLRNTFGWKNANFLCRKKIAGRSILPSPLYRYQVACYSLISVRKGRSLGTVRFVTWRSTCDSARVTLMYDILIRLLIYLDCTLRSYRFRQIVRIHSVYNVIILTSISFDINLLGIKQDRSINHAVASKRLHFRNAVAAHFSPLEIMCPYVRDQGH